MSKERILLIDDDTYFGNLFGKFAASKDIHVDYFENLLDASYGAKLDAYDAVVVDCCIPECDGFEITQYFQTFFRGVKIIMISGSDSALRKYAHVGAKGFVPKSQGVGTILAVALARTEESQYESRVLP